MTVFVKLTTTNFIKNYGRLADKYVSELLMIVENCNDGSIFLAADER